MTNNEKTEFQEINWEKRILERIKFLYEPELIEIDNYIDFIKYKRIASINEQSKKVEEIFKLSKIDGLTLKKEINELEKYEPTGSILKHNCVYYLEKRLGLKENDAELVLKDLYRTGYLKETSKGNVRVM